MYIVTSSAKDIVDSSFVERFCIVEKPDAVLVIASYSAERAVTIGKYANREEADDAFFSLLHHLPHDAVFYMPDSALFHAEARVKDARTKRKGGS